MKKHFDSLCVQFSNVCGKDATSSTWSRSIINFLVIIVFRKELLVSGVQNWTFKGKLKWSIITLRLSELPTRDTSRCGLQMLLLCPMCIKWLCLPQTETSIFMICPHQFTHHNFILMVSYLNC